MLRRLTFALIIVFTAFAACAGLAQAQEQRVLSNSEHSELAGLDTPELNSLRGGERGDSPAPADSSERDILERAQAQASQLDTLRGGDGTSIILFTLGLLLVVIIIAAWQMA